MQTLQTVPALEGYVVIKHNSINDKQNVTTVVP